MDPFHDYALKPFPTSQPRSRKNQCCVYNCKNTESKKSGFTFYSIPSDNIKFPHRIARRETWLRILRKHHPDGLNWVPNAKSRICSEHFVGNRKSEDPRSPNYNPSIFPGIKPRINPETALKRYQRKMKRDHMKEEAVKHKKVKFDTAKVGGMPKVKMHSKKVDKEIQLDFLEVGHAVEKIFVCNRYILSTTCEAETQTHIPLGSRRILIDHKRQKVNIVRFADKETMTPDILPYVEEKVQFIDETESTTIQDIPENEIPGKENPSRFQGLSSIKDDQEMMDLAGVTIKIFHFLLKIMTKDSADDQRKKVSDENKLLAFLMKLRSGMTFLSMSPLFNLHRCSISRNFYSVLDVLSKACKQYVFWPTTWDKVEKTMPEIFKPEYTECKIIMEITDFDVEQPKTKESKISLYSQTKKGYAIQNVLGYLPCGFICHVGKCYGGQKSDIEIVKSSKLLDLLEKDDMILCDKKVPEVQTFFEKSEKNISVLTPSLSYYENYSEGDEKLQRDAEIKICIEKIKEKVRMYKILDKFALEMLPHCDKIVFICCVLANLQSAVIKGM